MSLGISVEKTRNWPKNEYATSRNFGKIEVETGERRKYLSKWNLDEKITEKIESMLIKEKSEE